MVVEKYFEKVYDIRSYECDHRGRLHPLSIFNFMQDLASIHAARLGFSIQALMEKKMTWVLSRIHLRVDKILHWGDQLRGRTWPSGTQGKFALRDFRLFDGKDEPMGVATTSWMVLDVEKRIPLKLENILNRDLILNEERALTDEFLPLAELRGNLHEKKFRVRYSDLDVNRHVNHVAYIDWALEAVPEEVLLRAYPVEVEVSYRREVFYNDRIISRAGKEASTDQMVFNHQVFAGNGEVEIARLRTMWK